MKTKNKIKNIILGDNFITWNRLNKKTVVNVGIRLNPNVNAQTIGKISTGRMQDKFGLTFKDAIKIVEKYKNSDSIRFKCLSVHIGSQILSNVPYQKMIRVVNNFLEKVSVNFEYVDFGGGMGIDYSSNKKTFDFKKLALEIHKFSKKNECKIILEPGRSIIGDTAVLISKVIYIKESPTKDFIILDAGMNDLIRPALYNAKHMIIPAIKSIKKSKKEYDFVGPICETSDRFLKMKKFQKPLIDSVNAIYGENTDEGWYKVSEQLAPHYQSIVPDLEDVVDHIDYVKNLIGIDHVGIGGDWDGVEVLPKNIENIGKLPALTKVLIDRGYTKKEIRKILGENFKRVFKEVL